MRKLLLGLAFSFAVSCETIPRSAIGTISPEKAVTLAKEEIARRHHKLPSYYQVKVVKSVMTEEIVGDTPILEVTFSASTKQRRATLYEVSINGVSGRTEAFINSRTLTPPQ